MSSFDNTAVGEFINDQNEMITEVINATDRKKMDFSAMAKMQSFMLSSKSKQTKFLKNISDADRAKLDSFSKKMPKRIEEFLKKNNPSYAQALNR